MLGTAADRAVHLLDRWVAAVAGWAWLALILTVAFTVLCVFYTVAHFSVNTDTSNMIAGDVPYKADIAAFHHAFPQDNESIVIVIDGRTPEAAEAAAAAITASLAADRSAIESVFWPAGEPFFRKNGLLYLDTAALGELSDNLARAQPLLGALVADPSLRGLLSLIDQMMHAPAGEIVGGEELNRLYDSIAQVIEARLDGKPQPLSWRSLFPSRMSEPGNLRQLVLVKPILDFSQIIPAEVPLSHVRQAIASLPPPLAGAVTVRLTGDAMLSYEELGGATKGALLAVIVSLGLVAVILVWGLGSPWLAFSAFATMIIGLIWTTAFGAAFVGEFNLISITFAVLFVGLGVDFAIHFVLRFREQMLLGHDRREAFPRTARGVGPALMFLAVAIAAGFLAFVPTAYAGLSELGLIAGIGMFIALFATVTVLPALLALGPLRALRRQPGGVVLSIETGLRRHAVAVALGAGLLAIAAALTLPLLRFDEDPLNLKDPNAESMLALRDLAGHGQVSLYPAEIVAANLDAAMALADRAAKLPGVDHVLTLLSLVPEDQEDKLAIIGDAAQFLLPILQSGEQAAPPDAAALKAALRNGIANLQPLSNASAKRLADALERLVAADDDTIAAADRDLFAAFPTLIGRLKDAMGAGPVTADDLPAPLRARWLTVDGRARVQIVSSTDAGHGSVSLRQFVDTVRTLDPDVTGPAVAVVEAGRAVTHAMLQATAYALVALTLLLLVALRSPFDLLLVLVPVVLAGLYAAGTAAILGEPLNFANVIVLPLVLGIGLAGCGQLLMRARLEPPGAALFATVTPRATVLSMMTVICSFGSLIVSSHRGTRSMGILLAIAITWALIATLVVLPALIELKERHLRRRLAARKGPAGLMR
jgi:hopanoid biosynthesis associated RND transporter like protein HpnN